MIVGVPNEIYNNENQRTLLFYFNTELKSQRISDKNLTKKMTYEKYFGFSCVGLDFITEY
jgi:hypothetical protein